MRDTVPPRRGCHVDGEGRSLRGGPRLRAESRCSVFSRTSRGLSVGEMTSTASSGAPGQKLAVSPVAWKRSLETNAASGARTVSGSVSSRKPVSAPKATPQPVSEACASSSLPIQTAMRPCLAPAAGAQLPTGRCQTASSGIGKCFGLPVGVLLSGPVDAL